MGKKNKKKNSETEFLENEVTVEDMPASVESAPEEEGEQISKIREILFGSRSRQIEGDLAVLEEKMGIEHAAMRREFHERFDSLEEYIKGEVKSILEQLERETENRSERLTELADKLSNTQEKLSTKSEEFHKRLDESERDLRDQILQARQRLTDDIVNKTQDLDEKLQKEAKNLRKGKADRTTMAALLTDMATRLTEGEEE